MTSPSPSPADETSYDIAPSRSGASTPATSIDVFKASEADSQEVQQDTSSEQLGEADVPTKTPVESPPVEAEEHLQSAFWVSAQQFLLVVAAVCYILVMVLFAPVLLSWVPKVPWIKVFRYFDNIWDEVVDVWYRLIAFRWWFFGSIFLINLLYIILYLFFWPKTVSTEIAFAIKNSKMEVQNALILYGLCLSYYRCAIAYFTCTKKITSLGDRCAQMIPSLWPRWGITWPSFGPKTKRYFRMIDNICRRRYLVNVLIAACAFLYLMVETKQITSAFIMRSLSYHHQGSGFLYYYFKGHQWFLQSYLTYAEWLSPTKHDGIMGSALTWTALFCFATPIAVTCIVGRTFDYVLGKGVDSQESAR
ncbi:hypothetical protein IL306_010849 [Fusarium sp. DS 682]|nr:hypothetical protein IL306_010849 [Fusarium sp. DS 682]